MSESSAAPHYANIVERSEELGRLRAQASRRKSLLVFGPEGSGKTRLLRRFLESEPNAIYVKQVLSPRDLLLSLLEGIRATRFRGIHVPSTLSTLSTRSLQGIAERNLEERPFLLVLDHLAGPSRVSTNIIKELNYYDRTPVVLASRSYHMEDIGALQSMCSDRSERAELKNFPLHIALEFAQKLALNLKLTASNLDQALQSIVSSSQGNPGSIVRMVEMAKLPKYRMGDQIKFHVLYLDHLMGTR